MQDRTTPEIIRECPIRRDVETFRKRGHSKFFNSPVGFDGMRDLCPAVINCAVGHSLALGRVQNEDIVLR